MNSSVFCTYCGETTEGTICHTCQRILAQNPSVGEAFLKLIRLSRGVADAYSRDKQLLEACKVVMELGVQLSETKWGPMQTPMLDTTHPTAALWMEQVKNTIELLKKRA